MARAKNTTVVPDWRLRRGVAVGLRRSGTLLVARDDDEARVLERQLTLRRSLRLSAERLRAQRRPRA